MLAVETRNLTRIYGSRNKGGPVRALDNVNLQIGRGEVRGLLGPNGAGKTTLIKILSTVLLASSGSASVLGHDVARSTSAVRSSIGIVLGGDRGLYANLSGRHNLEFWAAMYNVPAKESRSRVGALLERVGLAERADSQVNTYSRGMKQRLHLARGLVGGASVLFLDEPTIGMDPLAAREFRQLVRDLRAEGRTILITTHDMAEAEAVCDRVALIDHGRLLAVETPRSLSELVAKYERIDFGGQLSDIVEKVSRIPGVASVSALPNSKEHRVELARPAAAREVLGLLVGAGVTSIRTSRPTLEEVYVHMIGDRGLRI